MLIENLCSALFRGNDLILPSSMITNNLIAVPVIDNSSKVIIDCSDYSES